MNLATPLVKTSFTNKKTRTTLKSNALLDTGAQVTCVPRSFISQLQLKATGVVSVTSVGGTLQLEEYYCDIKVGKHFFPNHKVIAVESQLPLIGWDILQRNFFEITTESVVIDQLINIVSYIKPIKDKTVLILGEDTKHIDSLRIIQHRLQKKGYRPIIAKDLSDLEIQSVEEKMNMLASISKFVVCENSYPSGHIDELKICAMNRFVTAILQEEGKGATWMQSDYMIDLTFVKVFTYPEISHIHLTIDKAVKWAESKLKERKKYFNDLYQWRKVHTS